MLKSPKFGGWDATLLPLGEDWGIVKYTRNFVSSGRDNGQVTIPVLHGYWYVVHSCGNLAHNVFAPTKVCMNCKDKIPEWVIGFYDLCTNKNIGL